MPAQQRRRRHDETVPTPRRKEASKRSDEGAIGRAKLRTRLLTRQHRQLVTKQHEFDVFGELGAPTPNEQPQNSGRRSRPIVRATVIAPLGASGFASASVPPPRGAVMPCCLFCLGHDMGVTA